MAKSSTIGDECTTCAHVRKRNVIFGQKQKYVCVTRNACIGGSLYEKRDATKGYILYNFEVYKPQGERSEKLPLVTLSEDSLVMNDRAHKALGKPEMVELSYSKDGNTIRIRPIGEDGLNVEKAKVFAKGFFGHFRIGDEGRFVAVYDEIDNALYVSLDPPNRQ